MKLKTSKTFAYSDHRLQACQRLCLAVLSDGTDGPFKEVVLVYDEHNGHWLQPVFDLTFIEVGYLSHVTLDGKQYRVKAAIEFITNKILWSR